MATYGALNNTNISSSRGSGLAYLSSFTMPEDGTLDSVHAFFQDLGSSDSYRFAIYEGGTSDTDITGATLVWQSSQVDTEFSGSGEWQSVAAGSESLTGSTRYWVVVHTASSSPTFSVASPDNGDLNLRCMFYLSSKGYLTGGFPSTAVATDGNASTIQSVKAYITYTAGGGGGGGFQAAWARSSNAVLGVGQ